MSDSIKKMGTPENAFRGGTLAGAVVTLLSLAGIPDKLGWSPSETLAAVGALFTIISAAAVRWMPKGGETDA